MTARRGDSSILEPFLRVPDQGSLILLSSTIDCSVNWLTAQCIGHFLAERREASTAIVIASWIRDYESWKRDLRRSVAVDADKMSSKGQFTFVDCFSQLPGVKSGEAALAFAEQDIDAAVTSCQARDESCRVVLVLDCPDILLALAMTTATRLAQFTTIVRRRAHAAILAVSADWALVGAAARQDHPTTGLETNTASFVIQQAHSAQSVMSVRQLETGAAKDVSGVLRITSGTDAYAWDDRLARSSNAPRELEALYIVNRDGEATVFSRGSAV